MATIEINRGNTYKRILRVKNGSGDAIDITGWTIFFTAKSKEDTDLTDSRAVIKKTITTFDDAAGGWTYFTLTSDDTRIPYGEYLFDFKIKNEDGSLYSHTVDLIKISNVAGNREE